MQTAPVGPLPFEYEQDWLVNDIVRTIVVLADAAAGDTGSETPGDSDLGRPRVVVGRQDEGAAYVVTVGAAAPVSIPITPHVWSPQTYLSLARTLLASRLGRAPAGNAPSAVDADVALHEALLDLRAEVLLEQDAALSRRLQAAPFSADAHEDAALLVGAFALREGFTYFTDVRAELSRMTAHLAIAAAFRGDEPATLDGALAGIVLTYFAGLEREAMAQLRIVERSASSVAQQAWVRALHLRIAGDWRTPLDSDRATRLEHLEYGRALRVRAGSNRFLDWLDELGPDGSVDWQRIALSNRFNYSTLEVTARFASGEEHHEIEQARLAWTALHEGKPSDAALMAALNAHPADGHTWPAATPVLSWPHWAAMAQRHLAFVLVARSRHENTRGDYGARRLLAEDLDARYAGLHLYPMVLRQTAFDAGAYARAMAASRRLVDTHPHLVTAANWNQTTAVLADVPVEPFPAMEGWFSPYVPTGTAFDLLDRTLSPGCAVTPTPDESGRWAGAQPYTSWTHWSQHWNLATAKPDTQQVLDALGDLLRYETMPNLNAIRHLDTTFEQTLRLARNLCDVDFQCGRLVAWLRWNGQPEEARDVFEWWIANSRDRMDPAAAMWWLVRYYARAGRWADAERVAAHAASTGSSRGITALADLRELQGRFAEAEALYQQLVRRYGEEPALVGFRLREALRRNDQAGIDAELARFRQQLPHGLVPVPHDGPAPPPADGVVTPPPGPRARAMGLQEGDILIGLNGWRVRTSNEYLWTLGLYTDDNVRLTVYRDGRYVTIPMRMHERTLGLDLIDHRPASLP